MDNQRIIELRTMPYEQYLQTTEWAEKREQALERDGHRCRACDSRENLNVHHRTYARRGDEDLNDLTTFCQPCHEHFHGRINQTHMMFQTYAPPREDPEAMKKRQNQTKEDYLIGLLVQYPGLVPHVGAILSEHDFVGDETRALYQLFTTISDQPFEQRVPETLKPVVSRAIETANEFPLTDEQIQVKAIVEVANRIKKTRCHEQLQEIKILSNEASKVGDKATARALLQKSIDIQRQLLTLDAVSKRKNLRDGMRGERHDRQ